ncbi:uncharacterized protein LOC122035309 [Zingiber officinale]|uniref:uncharacterized protein LOC122035309 n=1 Tax=Zingiber officinale TaxID=94328 RepID=UPI001C4BEE04|nr:uncharacterized protein LOC122035309 [Zingiber officinale]
MTDNFVQPAIPKFDGYYDHWSMLMENFLRSKEYWDLVETRIPVAVEGVELTEAQGKLFADQKLKDLKVKNYLFQAIDRTIMKTILNKDTAKHIWDSMKQKFDYVVCSIEKSNNLDILSLDELQSSLLVHEQRMNRHGNDEQALKMTYDKIGEDAARGRAMQEVREDVWFLDSGCSNHMCAHKEWFSDLDEEFRTSVKLGNNSTMTVMGKGNIMLQIVGATQIWASKFQGFKNVAIQANGKQHRNAIPKKSLWRASQRLQLVHADICGPINPASNGKKRQLTAAYTPQQNGVAECKNRTIMNMVRSMLSEKQVPKTFWPEAANWVVHILNRSPTLAVKNMTPEEAWSGVKPNVEYFRVFGCIGHVHISDSKRKKLDDKSLRCVLLGMSEESKVYRLYDPASKTIIVSRDMIFEENECWEWRRNNEEAGLDILVQEETNVESAHDQSEEEYENVAIEEEEREVSLSSSESPEENLPERRQRRKSFWMEDYVSREEFSEEGVEHNNLVLFTSTSVQQLLKKLFRVPSGKLQWIWR